MRRFLLNLALVPFLALATAAPALSQGKGGPSIEDLQKQKEAIEKQIEEKKKETRPQPKDPTCTLWYMTADGKWACENKPQAPERCYYVSTPFTDPVFGSPMPAGYYCFFKRPENAKCQSPTGTIGGVYCPGGIDIHKEPGWYLLPDPGNMEPYDPNDPKSNPSKGSSGGPKAK